MKTILVVDDEKDIIDLLKYNLQKEGYAVQTAQNGKRALEQAQKRPDLIVLDVMMPEMDGWEVCKELKRRDLTSSIPIIFLTAKGTEVDEVVGLELGADDYIVKPISIRKLVARIKTVLRRHEPVEPKTGRPPDLLRVEQMEINVQNYKVKLGKEEISFPKKEFETLVYLVRHRGSVVTREALLNAVWGEDVVVVERTVDVHIRKIREKLGKYGDCIETIKGVGYRFTA
ncbi:MAG: response regulator transcription factor [Bacteroidota bacterium]|jgi:two-component system alkaline phosphatase synthesis response regulator PhoP